MYKQWRLGRVAEKRTTVAGEEFTVQACNRNRDLQSSGRQESLFRTKISGGGYETTHSSSCSGVARAFGGLQSNLETFHYCYLQYHE